LKPVTPAERPTSPLLQIRRQSGRRVWGTKKAQPLFHRLGTACGRTAELSRARSGDGRHLGCSGTRPSSRRIAGGGPTRRGAPRAQRWANPCVGSKEPTAVQASPACNRHGERQEVSEPIGLGRSSHRERLRWEVPKPRGSCLGQGPWPVTSRLAAPRKRRRHPQVRIKVERPGS
jgi:hypothetical protein